METHCLKIKHRPGSLPRVREWAAEINRRQAEALATLRDEGAIVETAFLDSTAEGDFLLYYMKAESFAQVKEVFAQSQHAIDAYHRQFMQEIYAEAQPLELLVDLCNFAPLRADKEN